MGGKKVTTEIFMEDVRKIHEGKGYEYEEDWEYTHSKCLIKVKCPDHGWWSTKAYSHRGMKSGCPVCAEEYRDNLSKKATKNKITKREQRRYDLHNSRDEFVFQQFDKLYKGELELLSRCVVEGSWVKVKCLKHRHIYYRTTGRLWVGKGCTECVADVHKPNPWEQVLDKFREIHGERYEYFPETYVDASTKLKVRCKHHGVFYVTPHNHIGMGSGCSSCANHGYNPSSKGYLYYIKINNNEDMAYKVGITNKPDIMKRFLSRDRIHIEIIKVWEFEDGREAYEKEQEILSKYSELRRSTPLSIDWSSAGITEMFSEDVLGLDV